MSAHMMNKFCNICRVYYFQAKQQILEQLRFPPFVPSLIPDIGGFAITPQIESSPEDDYNGILYAVPKKRRSLERRRKIGFGFMKRMENAEPKSNIVTCPACGGWHESHTICGACYEKVREKTEEMKAELAKQDDSYYFNQTTVEIKDLMNKFDITHNTMKSEQDRYKDEVTWFDENLKKRVN